MVGRYNSMVTRVRPVFTWLCAHSGPSWVKRVREWTTACGTSASADLLVDLDPERKLPASHERLTWMLEKDVRFAPR
jgi:hypothetical protein